MEDITHLTRFEVITSTWFLAASFALTADSFSRAVVNRAINKREILLFSVNVAIFVNEIVMLFQVVASSNCPNTNSSGCNISNARCKLYRDHDTFFDNDQLQQLNAIRYRLPLIENKKFDYPSFIRYINLNIIWETLYVLYSPNTSNSANSEPPSDPNLFNNIELILTVLLKMLAQKLTNLQRFAINLKFHSSNLDDYSKGGIKTNILELLLKPKISDLLRRMNYYGFNKTLQRIHGFTRWDLLKFGMLRNLGSFDESQIDDAAEIIRSQTNAVESVKIF
ncbi:19342_t:CDS:2 [Dentiscutata erythropus]|uniref:19342_t:CDS:1 n=1 Tax=Dentiscutata erythropus TaxID=1348616 RepID=A0A9N9IQ03_9GLOM|nr:19342_t:CDS:2 [Dentiscutata erythropus]